MKKIFHADIRFIPEYFNRVCNATIPPYYQIICYDVPHFISTNIQELVEEELKISADTPDFAVSELIKELKNRGLTGKLRVNHSYAV